MKDWIEIDKKDISRDTDKCLINKISETLFAVQIHELYRKRDPGLVKDSKAFPLVRRKLIEREFFRNNITVKDYDNIRDFDEKRKFKKMSNYGLYIYSFEVSASSIEHVVAIIKDGFEQVDKYMDIAIEEVGAALNRRHEQRLREFGLK